MKILIIEDERKLSDSIVSYLSSEKYLCEQAFTFAEARMRVNVYDYDRVVSKSAMAEHLSGDMADVMDNHDFVYTHIKNLKAKLAEAGCRDCIRNVYGMGYKWVEL